MRIAQLAPIFESVPPAAYGGTERVVDWLTRELVRRGHEVTLFASGDSRTPARLVAVTERALRAAARSLVDPIAWHLRSAGICRARLNEFDVVHSHLDYLPFEVLGDLEVPLVTTLHGRLDLDGVPELFEQYPEQPVVSISYAQRAPIPHACWAANVYHGLPLERYQPGPGDGDYFVFLGRISPEKRPDVAIEVARRAGVRLVIAAKVDRVDRPYFESVVKEMLDQPGIEFLGEVQEAKKAELLRHARGLLFPILWPEPFGLAMIEAMAFGTPVITRRCGSTPEVVAHQRVGFVCDDDDELVEAVRSVDEIDRGACRSWVEQHFSAARMAEQYEKVYASLVRTPDRRAA